MSETILVTGVGKRLGFALAQELLADGYRVVGTYRSDYPQLQCLRDNGADLQQVDFYQENSLEAFLNYVAKSTRYSEPLYITHPIGNRRARRTLQRMRHALSTR